MVTTIGESGRVVMDQTGQPANRLEAGLVEPISTGGELVIVVNLPESEFIAVGNLAGQIADDMGRPIDGFSFHQRSTFMRAEKEVESSRTTRESSGHGSKRQVLDSRDSVSGLEP